jgi:hypothetical protein
VDFVFVVPGQSQVIFLHADGLLIFEQEVQVLSLEFVRNLEIAMPGNVFSGQLDPGSAGNIPFDNGADSGWGLVHEGVYFVLLHFDTANNVVPLNGDFIGSAVFNNDLAVVVAVNGDE